MIIRAFLIQHIWRNRQSLQKQKAICISINEIQMALRINMLKEKLNSIDV